MKTTLLAFSALAILGFGSWSASAATVSDGASGISAPLTVEGPSFTVSVSHQTECCPKSVELKIRADQGVTKTLHLSGRIQTLKSLLLVANHRLLVTGDLRYGGTNLWIANLESLVQEAEIWTYGYGVSPSGRWLAYQTHYPRMVPPDGRRSIFLLHDLTEPPAGERPAPEDEWPEPSLGQPIFPKANVEEKTWSIFAAEHPYSLSSPFLWSPDETMLVFLVVEHGPVGTLKSRGGFIVRVDLSQQGEVLGVHQERLTLGNLDLPRATVPLPELEERHLVVNLDTLRWAKERGSGWVVGETALPGDELGTKIWIRVPVPEPDLPASLKEDLPRTR